MKTRTKLWIGLLLTASIGDPTWSISIWAQIIMAFSGLAIFLYDIEKDKKRDERK